MNALTTGDLVTHGPNILPPAIGKNKTPPSVKSWLDEVLIPAMITLYLNERSIDNELKGTTTEPLQ